LLESFNGENWSLVFSIPYDTGYEEELKTCIRSVIKHENKYIAVTSKRIITSTDGTNWKIVLEINNDFGAFLNDIVWNGNEFIAAGSVIYKSKDGNVWVKESAIKDNPAFKILSTEEADILVGACLCYRPREDNKKVLIIKGDDFIDIPSFGFVSTEYSSDLIDARNQKLDSTNIIWELDKAYEGISIDRSTGRLTVNSNAKECSIILIAKNLEYGVEGRKLVIIGKEFSSKLDPYVGRNKESLFAKVVKGIQYLNKYRSRMGLSELSYNEWLTYAAQGHSNYLNVNGKTGHYQTIGDRGFFGVSPMDRAIYYGYYGSIGEGISYGYDDIIMAIASLMDAPYHRLNHINPNWKDIGIGFDGITTTVVYGTKKSMTDERIVVYPYEGQTDVKTTWFVAEDPNPLRFFDKDGINVGYPISISIHDSNTKELKTLSASLRDEEGSDVPFYLVDSSKETDFKKHAFIIPQEPLKSDTEYTVSVKAVRITNDKKEIPVEKEWTFKTVTELDISRITGSTRLVTAVNISKEGWSNGAKYAVLTSGWEFADALAGSTFAYLKDAPILLTRPSSLSAEVKDELKRLKVEKVYILGGNAAVSDGVANELVSLGYTVERIYGSQRFETAVKIGDEIRKEKAFDTVILATSHNFPDALAIGPVAAREGMPILFTRPGSLHETTKEAIRKWGIKKVIIVGGNAAVSKDIEEELKGMGLSVDRVSGSDRYWTAVEIARRFDKGDYSGVMMATGLNFADALTGSVLAAKKGMPIILSRQTVLVPSVEEYLRETDYGKSRIVVLGGTAAIAEEVVDRIRLMWAAGM